MANSEQRFGCNVCDKTWTGIALEHCKSCHETFNNTRAGDKHTSIAFLYTLVRDPFQGLVKLLPEDVAFAIRGGCKIVSENNEMIDCLTAAEMRAKGMNQEKNGCWNSGGNWTPDIYKKD